MEKLEKEQVLHVADLARLYVKEEEINKYAVQLSEILTEIDKINKVNIEDGEMLIAPTTNKNEYREDEIGTMLEPETVLKNAKHVSDGYIIVPRVIGND